MRFLFSCHLYFGLCSQKNNDVPVGFTVKLRSKRYQNTSERASHVPPICSALEKHLLPYLLIYIVEANSWQSLYRMKNYLTDVTLCKPNHWDRYTQVFTARGYAKRGICRRRVSVCVSVCLCVCVSVCLSHSNIVSKRLNVGSRKQRRTIAP